MKLTKKSGARIAMTAAALVVTGTLVDRRHGRRSQGPLLRRQRLLPARAPASPHKNDCKGQECL